MDFYNEWDPYCAQWLRNLIAAKLIPEGVVDSRDIREIQSAELASFRRVHLFAGIGGWPLALQLAGWPDDRPVWTGSCPCQPFSCAGKRKGQSDERHLWPEFLRLIEARRPSVVFGEQVSGDDGLEWLTGVRADLAACRYRGGAADLCAAGVGAPHIRQRLYWVADDERTGLEGQAGEGLPREGRKTIRPLDGSGPRGLGQPVVPRLEGHAGNGDDGHEPGRVDAGAPGPASSAGADGGMDDAAKLGRGWRSEAPAGPNREGPRRSVQASGSSGDSGVADTDGRHEGDGGLQRGGEYGQQQKDGRTGERVEYANSRGWTARESTATTTRHGRPIVSAGGFWSAFDLIPCGDGKARRVEPGTFPLAHGVPGRVGKLRAYGNAIVPQVAAKFIQAYLETENLK